LGVFEVSFGFKLWQVSGAIGAFGFEFLSDLAPVGTLLLALNRSGDVGGLIA